MILCRNCGHENPEDPKFCSNCGEFLPWDDATRVDTRGGDRGAGVTATLAGDELQVAAGGELECELQVRNTGRVVDHLTIQVLGAPAAWAAVDPDSLQLMPNQEGTATIRFRPPRSSEVPAGRTPFSVQVTSRADPTVTVRVESSLNLEPFTEIQAELIPRTSESRQVGEHRLTVTNAGNQTLQADLAVSDPDQKLRTGVRPRRLQLPPSDPATAQIMVRPRRLRLIGQPVNHPFQVAITRVNPAGQQDAAPTTVDGAMLQRALLPTWVIPVAAALLTLLIGAIAFAANRPASDTTATTVATLAPATTTTAPTTTTTTTTTTLGGGGFPPPTGGNGGQPPPGPTSTRTTASSSTTTTATTTPTTTTLVVQTT